MEEVARRFLDGLLATCRADPRILGVTFAGSAATGQMHEFSDVDTVIVSTDESHADLLAGASWPGSVRVPGRAEAVPALATVGDHSVDGCTGALRAAIALYRELRDPAVERRAAAEERSVAYLEEVASRAARASR
jgi:hypothetical protein